jgi:NAD(P)-dependent dehydrogenase (short-subunit alcohol dehydrogenase family)
MRAAVIGSNRGIGLAITEQLIQEGHEVYAFCRKKSAELVALKPFKIFEDFNVTDFEKMQSILIENKINNIDQLFHVSGIMLASSLDNFDIEAIKEQFLINSIAPILTCQIFLPHLSENAKLGLLSSRMGSIEDNDSGGAYGYRMSKSALNSAGKSLAIDLKNQNKAVFLLHPGWVKTDMTEHTGHLNTKESAQGLIKIMQEKTIKDTGTFWHVNGEQLPW